MNTFALPCLSEQPPGVMIRDKNSWKYTIELPILPFTFDGEDILTSIRMDSVDFKTANLKHLAEKNFIFSLNPHDGYIDASVYLMGTHVPIDVKEIFFTKITQYKHMAVALATFKMTFLFEEIMLENRHETFKTNLIIFNG